MSTKKWSVTYNAKFTLTFCIVAFLVHIFNKSTGNLVNQMLMLLPDLSLGNLYRMLTYIFCHADFSHLLNNTLYLLLLGPMLEEKYGSKLLFFMTFVTAIITAVLNTLLFSDAIIGASGIVFMFIVLSSIVNMKEKEIPITFLLVVVIFLGGEIIQSFKEDEISQFGHILGGLCGGILGFAFNKRKLVSTE